MRDPRQDPHAHDVVRVDGHDLRVALVLARHNVYFWLNGRDKTMATIETWRAMTRDGVVVWQSEQLTTQPENSQ